MVSHTQKRQKAEYIQWKLLLMPTAQMIQRFSQIQQPKPNFWCIGQNKQEEALASTLTQIKQSKYVLNKMEPNPHELANHWN